MEEIEISREVESYNPPASATAELKGTETETTCGEDVGGYLLCSFSKYLLSGNRRQRPGLDGPYGFDVPVLPCI